LKALIRAARQPIPISAITKPENTMKFFDFATHHDLIRKHMLFGSMAVIALMYKHIHS